MSFYEPSSPDSDSQCFSPGSCGDESNSKKYPGVTKSKRLKASARERRRRHVLNDALEHLRHKVSAVHTQNPHKLSKIEVLRLAIDYIGMMSYYLDSTASPTYTQERNVPTFIQQPYEYVQYQSVVPHNIGHLESLQKDVSLNYSPSAFRRVWFKEVTCW